jgi:hypothetical protein
MGHGFNCACVLKHTLNNMLNAAILIIIYIDSFSLYECLVKLGTTNKKHLMINLMAIQQAYECREIVEIVWIKGNHNPANSMTKHNGNNALNHIIKSNRLHIEAEGWVERNSAE